jgi:hypothetical protein
LSCIAEEGGPAVLSKTRGGVAPVRIVGLYGS